MESVYNVNGLIFWSEAEIRLRRRMEAHFVDAVTAELKTQNRGFEVVQVEAPQLTPRDLVQAGYDDSVMFVLDQLVLRPETTMGSYAYLRHLLNPHGERKYKLPLCVWQHGKSFRREQDQPTKFVRLKEFHQLEFQIAFAPSTANDYSVRLVPAVRKAIADMIGPCRIEPSDRLPDYAEWTKDIVCEKNAMEVCSISARKDFPDAKILEVAIGTDRCVVNFQAKD